jgi:hypothetical protein
MYPTTHVVATIVTDRLHAAGAARRARLLAALQSVV